MRFHTTISYKPVTNDKKSWMVTYDGRILGDDRIYDTAEKARAAALKIVDDRPLVNGVRQYIFKPY